MPSYWAEHQGMLVLAPEPTTTDDIRLYGKKKPNVLSEVSYTSEVQNIAFVHSDTAADYVTDGNNKFVTSPNIFRSGDMIRISDSLTNDGVYLAATVVLGKITLHPKEVFTTEGISANQITFTTVSHFEEEYEDVIQALAAYRIAKNFGLPNVNEIRDTYLEYRAEVWPGMDYKPQSVRVDYRRL